MSERNTTRPEERNRAGRTARNGSRPGSGWVRAGALVAGAAFLGLVAPGCGDDDPTRPAGDPVVRATLTLSSPGGGDPAPGDTLVSAVTVENAGGSATETLMVRHPGLFHHRIRYVGFDSTAAGVVRVQDSPLEITLGPFSLAAGASKTYRVRFVTPRYLTDGREVTVQAQVFTLPEDPLATETWFTDDPATAAEDDATVWRVENAGRTFTLTAPLMGGVQLAGSFNGWDPDHPDYGMIPGTNGGPWSLTVPLDGRHEYKFIIQEDPRKTGAPRAAWIGDPRSTHLAFDGFGGWNSVSGLALPDPVEPLPGGPDPAKLVIYELFVDDFSSAGTFDALAAGLDGGLQNLADLGVNAIQLMPVTATSPGFNWGYEPRFYFAAKPEYGGPDRFAALVEKAHSLGMAVILDMVFNHVGGGGALERIDDLGGPGTYINHEQPVVFGMRQVNWESIYAREFFLDAALFWIEQYGIDGFRMDFVDPADYDGYTWWVDEIKSRHPDVFLIAEDFSFPIPGNAVTVAGFDAQWGGQKSDPWGGIVNNFQNLAIALLKEGPYTGRAWFPPRGSFETEDNPMWGLANILSWHEGYPSHTNEIKYIVSHDERRVVDEVDRDGSAGAKAVGGIAKAKLGAVMLFTAVGVPMFYMGEEIGEDDFTPDSPAPNPVDWAAGDDGVRAVYRNLIRLRGRAGLQSLWGPGIEFHGVGWGLDQGPFQRDKTIVYWRFHGPDPAQADVVVAMNLDHQEHDLLITFPEGGEWLRPDLETWQMEFVTVPEGRVLSATLPASTAWIFLHPSIDGPLKP